MRAPLLLWALLGLFLAGPSRPRRRHNQQRSGSYEVGNWNCKVGRNTQVVAAFIGHLLRSQDLDVLVLQEAGGYRTQIAATARRLGYDVYQPGGVPDADNIAFLFRKGMLPRNPLLRVMVLRWWGAKTRTWRAPRSLPSIRAGRIRWYGVHRVAYQFDQRNLDANIEFDRVLAEQIIARPNIRHVPVGDWNDGQKVKVMRDLVARVGGTTAGEGIEWVLAVGKCSVGNHRRLGSGGSDHHARIYTVRWWT